MVALRRLILIMITLAVLGSLPTQAQSSGTMHISLDAQSTDESGDSLQLNLYFHVVDDQGQVVAGIRLKQVLIQSDEGESVEAAIDAQQSISSYVALVLDTSPSMGTTNAAMREAAKNAVTSAPDNTFISVWTFDTTVTQRQDFSKNHQNVSDTIDTIRSTTSGGTCLYDAAFNAVTATVNQPVGRRAVILFTDGVDETESGARCSIHNENDVITLAAENRVPVYTVGLMGSSDSSGNHQINASELNEIAQQTGAMNRNGGQNDLADLFQTMFEAIANQWQAQANLYPTIGTHTLTLTPILDSGLHLPSTAFSVLVSKNYDRPFQASINNLTYDPQQNQYMLEMSVQGAARVQRTVISIVSSGKATLTLPFDGFPPQIPIDGSALNAATQYKIRIQAFDKSGNLLTGTPADYDFTHQPPPGQVAIPPQVTLIGLTPNDDVTQLAVGLNIISPAQVSSVQVQVRKGGATVSGLSAQMEHPPANPVLTLALRYPPLEYSTQYDVVIWLFDQNGNVINAQQAVTGSFDSAPGPQPPIVNVKVRQPPGANTVTLEFYQRFNTDQVANTSVDIANKATSSSIATKTITGVPATYDLPSDVLALLAPGTQYDLHLMLLDASGRQLIGLPVEAAFTYMPTTSPIDQVKGVVGSPLALGLLIAVAVIVAFAVITYERGKKRGLVAADVNKWLGGPRTTLAPEPKARASTHVDLGLTDVVSVRHAYLPRTTEIATDNDFRKSTKLRALISVYAANTIDEDLNFVREYRMERLSFKVGREGSGDINLNWDLNVSHEHFTIRFDEASGNFILTDTSQVGTKVNGKLVHNDRLVLPENEPSRIEIGSRIGLKFEPQLSSARRSRPNNVSQENV